MYLPPHTLLGSCELCCVLGRGGGGISYLAFDTVLQRPVVLKEHFPAGLCTRQKGSAEVEALEAELYVKSLATFCREARLQADLNHPNVVKVHDIFEASGTAYIIMDYAEGRTLSNWLPAHAADYPAVRNVLCKLLQTLDYLHHNHVLHRDVKPSNIIVRPNGEPLLLDFGSAHSGAVYSTLTAVGSPGYAAPEQFSPHGRSGPWSDLYGLAQSFLQLLPEDARRHYPRSFMAPLLQAAQPEPKVRPQSAAAWLVAMQRYPLKRALWIAAGTVAAVGIIALLPLSIHTEEPAARPISMISEQELDAMLQTEFDRYSRQLEKLQREYSTQRPKLTLEDFQRRQNMYKEQYLRHVEDIKRNYATKQ